MEYNNNYGWSNVSPEEQDEYGQNKRDRSYNLAVTATALGIASIGSTFFLPVFVPCILGSIAIVLAILSKGSSLTLLPAAKRAVLFATIGIVINVSITVTAVVSAPRVFRDPQLHSQLNDMSSRLYGVTFDEMVKDIDETYGIDLSGYLGIQ